MFIANVIWPTFITPYVTWVMLPFMGPVIFGLEIGAGLILQRKKERKIKIAWVIAVGNLCSSGAGFAAGMLLSQIPGEMNDLTGDSAGQYLLLSYLVAFILSVVIEAFVFSKLLRKNCWALSGLLNCVSYGAIAVVWIVLS